MQKTRLRVSQKIAMASRIFNNLLEDVQYLYVYEWVELITVSINNTMQSITSSGIPKQFSFIVYIHFSLWSHVVPWLLQYASNLSIFWAVCLRFVFGRLLVLDFSRVYIYFQYWLEVELSSVEWVIWRLSRVSLESSLEKSSADSQFECVCRLSFLNV